MYLAMDRELQVLDEEFTAAAFDHQELVQDLFEATGAAGFDKVSTKLGLKDTEGMLDYQRHLPTECLFCFMIKPVLEANHISN